MLPSIGRVIFTRDGIGYGGSRSPAGRRGWSLWKQAVGVAPGVTQDDGGQRNPTLADPGNGAHHEPRHGAGSCHAGDSRDERGVVRPAGSSVLQPCRRRIGDLATIGPIEGGGSCRLALTEEDRLGRDLVVAWMRDLDLDVTIDGIGNVVAVRPGRLEGPPTMMGSHIDTVRTGGRYDGNLGVLAGLEVIRSLNDHHVETEAAIEVIVWTNEEGSRFAPAMISSAVFSAVSYTHLTLPTILLV